MRNHDEITLQVKRALLEPWRSSTSWESRKKAIDIRNKKLEHFENPQQLNPSMNNINPSNTINYTNMKLSKDHLNYESQIPSLDNINDDNNNKTKTPSTMDKLSMHFQEIQLNELASSFEVNTNKNENDEYEPPSKTQIPTSNISNNDIPIINTIPMPEEEEDDDNNFNNLRYITSVSEVIVYYKDNGKISLKVDVCMNSELTIRKAHKIAGKLCNI